MIDFSLHPNVYSSGTLSGLRGMLEQTWVRSIQPGDGTIYLVSGFANYNGGARFYRTFKEHTDNGGRLVAFLGGSAHQRLSSKQVVEALLSCGAEVNLVNRKRLLHAKCYGRCSSSGQSLVVTSGNFTGPGMSQNVEAALLIEGEEMSKLSFQWADLEASMKAQGWMILKPDSDDLNGPAWQLLYDETPGRVALDTSEEITLVVVLGHSDTARIQADRGTKAAEGTQYFWLSKDSFDFFPPLTIRNDRGYKGTLSAIVTMEYPQIDIIHESCRVTFEAKNNLDFRLGTGPLRYTKLVEEGDIACISRLGETEYQMRAVKAGTAHYEQLSNHAIHFIGNKGKRYGYIDNQEFFEVVGGL